MLDTSEEWKEGLHTGSKIKSDWKIQSVSNKHVRWEMGR